MVIFYPWEDIHVHCTVLRLHWQIFTIVDKKLRPSKLPKTILKIQKRSLRFFAFSGTQLWNVAEDPVFHSRRRNFMGYLSYHYMYLTREKRISPLSQSGATTGIIIKSGQFSAPWNFGPFFGDKSTVFAQIITYPYLYGTLIFVIFLHWCSQLTPCLKGSQS